MIQDNLMLGIGSDRLYDLTPKYMTPQSLELITDTRMDNPHNWFIHFGASFGLIPLLALLSILAILIVRVILSFRGAPFLANAQFPVLVMLIAIVIDGLVSIEQPGLGIWMYLLMGCLLGLCRVENGRLRCKSGSTWSGRSAKVCRCQRWWPRRNILGQAPSFPVSSSPRN
jgi:O-antigen ligase